MANQIRRLRKEKGITLEELAETSGISATHLSRMETGARGLSLENVVKVARALEVDPIEITDEFDHEDLAIAGDMPMLGKLLAHEGDIQNLVIPAGAGGGGSLSVQYHESGQLVDPDLSDGFWSFPASIKAGWSNLDRILAMPVVGDSMEPTLAKGSTVFVDTAHGYPSPEDVYACDCGDGLVIKRLKLVPRSDKILIISDNKERYGEPDELRREDVHVYGRVVAWFQWRG